MTADVRIDSASAIIILDSDGSNALPRTSPEPSAASPWPRAVHAGELWKSRSTEETVPIIES